MPRILIADDNSNIQRMAALALKDAGIEVIAVGNGEAAVRKMPEVLPDLVLADIFMPVRNGYELCEFVKHDPRYTNIPVLLLAGAFDPFDEHEAQRVHADGVVKKPFVPPDPLINAVKTLLAKSAGERLMAVTIPATVDESARTTSAAPQVLELPADGPCYESPEELALPLDSVHFGADQKIATFAQSPESPAAEADEAEPVVTASRDPSLGEPTFWVQAEETTQAEQAPSQDLTDHTWSSESRAIPLREEHPLLEELEVEAEIHDYDLILSEPVSQDGAQDLLMSAKPARDAAEDRPAGRTVPLPEIWAEPAALATRPLLDSSPSEPAALPLPTEAPPIPLAPIMSASSLCAPPEHSSAASKDVFANDTLPLPETWPKSGALEMAPFEDSSANESAPSALSTPLPTEVSPIPPAPIVIATSRSEQVPSEAQEIPTLELAETALEWNEPIRALHERSPETEPQEKTSEPEPELAIEWPPAFIPAISSGVNEPHTPALQIVPAAQTTPATNEPEPDPDPLPVASLEPQADSLSPTTVEAIVQRVIERMQPQIIEIVTRDLVRPLVEALVHDELKK